MKYEVWNIKYQYQSNSCEIQYNLRNPKCNEIEIIQRNESNLHFRKTDPNPIIKVKNRMKIKTKNLKFEI